MQKLTQTTINIISLSFILILSQNCVKCLQQNTDSMNNLTLEDCTTTRYLPKQLDTSDTTIVTNNDSINNNNSTTTETVKQKPCSCAGGLCACCSRLLYDTWKQKACVNITYEPDEFSFTTKIMLNERIIYKRSVSLKNPRPVCVPVPRIPGVRACVRFYNIYFQGRNIHACVNLEGKFSDTTLVQVSLDCMRAGAQGIRLVKPEDGGGLGQVVFLPNIDGDGDEDGEGESYDDDSDEDDYDDDY